MKKLSIFVVGILLFFTECSKVPITGRRQLDIVPQSQVLALSNSTYSDFLSKNKVVNNTEQAEMVKRVGRNVALAVDKYFRQIGESDELKGYKWEFNLVDDPSINAWALPGGKVVIYTGILPVVQDEAGLAVVMGHEIAHAIAKHGNERMSQALTQQLGGVALAVALRNKPQETQGLFMSAYGLGSQVGVLLPYGRLQESEADRLGLVFMAMAGYDPNKAIPFWQRMDAANKGPRQPQFLSTHPNPETRIKDIKSHLPEAMKYYNPSGVSSK